MPGLSEFSSGYGLDEVTTKSGRRKARAQEQQLDTGALQLAIAKELYRGTQPVRDIVSSALTAFSGYGALPQALTPAQPDLGGLDTFVRTGDLPTALEPVALPSVPDLTTAKRDVLESQFRQARANTVANTPVRGGTLGAAMTQLEGERALGVAGLYDRKKELQYAQDLQEAQREGALRTNLYGIGLDLNREEANRENQTRRALYASAIGTAYGQPQSALGGLSGASSTFGNVASLALTEALEKQKRAQDKAGTFAGFGLGSKGGGGKGA